MAKKNELAAAKNIEVRLMVDPQYEVLVNGVRVAYTWRGPEARVSFLPPGVVYQQMKLSQAEQIEIATVAKAKMAELSLQHEAEAVQLAELIGE